jgi:ketosteroid isomerase-like protein
MSATDLDGFKRAVLAANERFSANFARGDAAAVVRDFYTADASMIAPDAPRQKGPEALAAVLGSMIGSGIKRATLTSVDLFCEGNLGYEIGNAELFADGPAIAAQLRYLVVWRKVDGAWRAAVDMFSAGTL